MSFFSLGLYVKFLFKFMLFIKKSVKSDLPKLIKLFLAGKVYFFIKKNFFLHEDSGKYLFT
jgi:hypothetical protein